MRTSRRTIISMAVAAVLLSTAVAGAQTPHSASAVLDQARAQAVQGQRAIFAIFHASW